MKIQRAAVALTLAVLAGAGTASRRALAEDRARDLKGGATVLQGLRTAIYHVPDIKQGRDWYAKALGIQPYFDQPFYVGFNVGGFELGLSPDARPAGKEGGVDVYWGVADIRAALDHFLAAGASKVKDIEDVGGDIKVVIVLDPFGNRFGLIYNPHFGK
jgi:predicted enzyme related to lactoylglutathione lyase